MNHFIVTLLTLVLGICGAARALAESTNLLEICVGLKELPYGFTNSKINTTDFLPPLDHDGRPPSLPAVWVPRLTVLSDADFVSYDQTNHTFTVTADVARRCVNAMRDRNGVTAHRKSLSSVEIPWMPFEVRVSGEPIYVGMFYSFASSTKYYCPLIYSDFDLSADSTNTVRFTIWAGEGETFDVRSDPRISAALVKLGLSK